jgi:transcriptional regulator with XRE-family HTH domain
MQPFTVEQVRAARAFLGWRQVDLGEASGLSFETIRNFETSRFPLSAESIPQCERRSRKLVSNFTGAASGSASRFLFIDDAGKFNDRRSIQTS